MTYNSQTALITGCSDGGLGSALVKALHKRGYTVFASVRNTARTADITDLERVHIITLDVTQKDSIAAAQKLVAEHTDRLDVLVNNAGVGFIGAVADVDIDQAKKHFDANFWGALAMTQAFLPQLILAHGLVMNVSSLADRLPIPWIGIYSSSKAALSAASNRLRVELAPLGVRVQTVLLGGVLTRFGDNLPLVELKDDSPYKSIEKEVNSPPGAKNNPASTIGQKPEQTAEKLANDIVRGKSGDLLRGAYASITAWCLQLLPHSWIVS
jgi:1-acylglycerone phosphate reductase